MGTEFHQEDDKTLEDSGDNSTMMQMHLMSLNYLLKNIKLVNFM